jgi:hypothetical protein
MYIHAVFCRDQCPSMNTCGLFMSYLLVKATIIRLRKCGEYDMKGWMLLIEHESLPVQWELSTYVTCVRSSKYHMKMFTYSSTKYHSTNYTS